MVMVFWDLNVKLFDLQSNLTSQKYVGILTLLKNSLRTIKIYIIIIYSSDLIL